MLISLLNVASVSVYVSLYLDMQMRVKISFNRDLEHFSKIEQYRETMSKIRDETQPVVRIKAIFSSLCTIGFLIQQWQLLHSSKNAFIMQSKSTFLEFFDVYSSLQICPPPPPKKKFFRGEIYWGWMTSFPSSTCFVRRSQVSRFASYLGVLPCRVWPSLRD